MKILAVSDLLLLLLMVLFQRFSSIEAYPYGHCRSSSLPVKPLSIPVTFYPLSGKRIINKQRRRSIWSSQCTNDVTEVERRPKFFAFETKTIALYFQAIHNKMSQLSRLPALLQTVATRYWWSIPLTLCAVPVFFGPVSTPPFWKMVQVDYIWECPDAALVIGAFLGSNLSYFLAGYRIRNELPPRRNRFFCPYGGLAFWIWAAGLVSTVFHAVQSMGHATNAEALYYVDHGIAGAAVFYFYHICGLPNRNALILGVAGLLCLALPLRPGYAWLHSLWHVLSAAAALMWTCQGKVARRKQLLSAVRDRVDD
jgi:hypothetical protein